MKINSMKSKRGIAPIVVAMILIAALLISIPFIATTVSGGDMDSLTPTSDSCNPTNIGVRITGYLDVSDTAFWGVQPEPVKISVSEVREYSLLGVLSQDYEWKVCLVNTRTNNEVDCDSGNDNHPGDDAVIQHQQYILDFKIPDNNCDDEIDDFDGKLVATVIEDGEEHTIEKTVSFRDGKWTES